ncbi:hypothetical protein LXA43DRAFT_1031205 [Ganoderma leucocontextum]|nr:hypothetical protein LXA43DRAFT_1031205 [Ganoderma leucocontextum]
MPRIHCSSCSWRVTVAACLHRILCILLGDAGIQAQAHRACIDDAAPMRGYAGILKTWRSQEPKLELRPGDGGRVYERMTAIMAVARGGPGGRDVDVNLLTVSFRSHWQPHTDALGWDRGPPRRCHRCLCRRRLRADADLGAIANSATPQSGKNSSH